MPAQSRRVEALRPSKRLRTKDGVASLSDLVRSSLRLRPDRIPIGEVRGGGKPGSDGTIQTRRPQQPWPKDRPFRILSIDGGGIRGILPASLLGELERRFLGGQSVARYFDMIAGTSTGGIIALGLAHGRSASEIRDFYIKRGGKIFPPPTRIGRFVRLLRRGHRYAYERGPLQNELLDIFGDSVLGQARAVN